MNKKSRVVLIGLITIALVLALAIPGLAKEEANFNLSFEFDEGDIDWDTYSADGGWFESNSDLAGYHEGEAKSRWIPMWGITKGTMIFISEDGESQIVIRFNLHQPTNKDDCSTGRFQFYSWENTGDYEGVGGEGRITACRPGWGDEMHGELIGSIYDTTP